MSSLLNAVTNLVFRDPRDKIHKSWDNTSRNQFVQDRIFELSKHLKLENGLKEIKWENGIKKKFILKNTATGDEYNLTDQIDSDPKVGQVFNDLKQIFDGKRPGFLEPTKEPEYDTASLKSDSSSKSAPVKPLLDEHQTDRSDELHESSKPHRHRHRRDRYGEPICSRCHRHSSRRPRRKYYDSYSSDDDARYLSRPYKSARDTSAAFSPADFLAFEHLKRDLEQTKSDLQTAVEERDKARETIKKMQYSTTTIAVELGNEKQRADKLAFRALEETREKLAAHQNLDTAFKLRDQAQERAGKFAAHIVALIKEKNELLTKIREVQNGAINLMASKDTTIEELRTNLNSLENALRHSQMDVVQLKRALRTSETEKNKILKMLDEVKDGAQELMHFNNAITEELRTNLNRLENALRHSQMDVDRLEKALATAQRERDGRAHLLNDTKAVGLFLLNLKDDIINDLNKKLEEFSKDLRHSQMEIDRLRDKNIQLLYKTDDEVASLNEALSKAQGERIELLQKTDDEVTSLNEALSKAQRERIELLQKTDAEVTSLNKALSKAQREKIELLQENDTLFGNNSQLENAIETLETKIREKNEEISKLKRQTKKELDSATSEIESLKNEVFSLEAAKSHLESELSNANEQIERNRVSIVELQNKLGLKENELSLSQSENFRLHDFQKQLITERDKAKALLEKFNRQLSDLKGKNSELESRLNQQNRDLKTLNSQLKISSEAAQNAHLEKKNSEARVKELETQLALLNRSNQIKIGSLENQLSHLQRGLEFANRENATLKLNKDELTLKIQSLENKLRDAENENIDLNTRNSALFSEINQLKQKLETLKTTFTAREASLQRDLESARQLLKISKDSLQEKDESLNQAVVNFERVKNNLAQQIETLKAALKNERSKGLDIAAKQSEINALQRQLEALQASHDRDIAAISAELNRSHIENSTLDAKAANFERQLNAQNAQFKAEQANLNRQINQLAGEKKAVEATLSRSDAENRRLRDQLDRTKNRLDKVIAENKIERERLINEKNSIEAKKARDIQLLKAQLDHHRNSREIPTLQAEILAEKAKSEAATRDYQREKEHVRRLQSEISNLQKSNQALKDELSEKDAYFLEIERGNDALYFEMASLQDRMEELRTEKFEKTLELESNLANFKSEKTEISKKIERSTREIEQLTQKIEELTDELTYVKKNRDGIRKVSMTELDIINEKDATIRNLKEQLERLRQESPIRPISNISSSESSNEDQLALSAAAAATQAKHLEIESLNKQLSQNFAKIKDQSSTIEQLNKDKETLEKAVETQTSLNRQQEIQLKKLSSQIANLTTQNESLTAENTSMMRRLQEVQQSFHQQNDQTQEIEDLKAKIASLQNDQDQEFEKVKELYQSEFERILGEKNSLIETLQSRLKELTERAFPHSLDGRSDSEIDSPDSSRYSSRNSSIGSASDIIDWARRSIDNGHLAQGREPPPPPLRRAQSDIFTTANVNRRSFRNLRSFMGNKD